MFEAQANVDMRFVCPQDAKKMLLKPARTTDSGRWIACGWSVVQFDHDEEMGPMHGMYGTLETVREVQRHHQES